MHQERCIYNSSKSSPLSVSEFELKAEKRRVVEDVEGCGCPFEYSHWYILVYSLAKMKMLNVLM